MRLAHPRVVVALALLLGSIAPARAQILVNGNFDQGPVIPEASPVHPVAPGSTALTGWTVTGGTVSIVTDNYWVPLSGPRSLVLSSSGPGAVEQSFSSSAGNVYRLTFWLTGEPFSSPTLKHLRVTAGNTQQDYTFDISPAWHWDMHWQQHTLDFTATGPATTLKFASLDASQWGPAIDSALVVLVSTSVPSGEGLALSAITPDPVLAQGRLTFSLPVAGRARLTIFDVQGRELARLADGDYGAGPHTIELVPARFGARPGVCIAVLQAAGRTLTRRFTVLR